VVGKAMVQRQAYNRMTEAREATPAERKHHKFKKMIHINNIFKFTARQGKRLLTIKIEMSNKMY
jgi:hypothetical protein